MSAATILFVDVVGFSKKPTMSQKLLVEALTAEVLHEIRGLLVPPYSTPSVIALPTGDGLALAFIHSSNGSWGHETILKLILRLHKWAYLQTPINSVSLRIGVHVGPVELITDINGRANLCGDTINYSQRVMDAANPRQTLYSEAAFREYIGSECKICTNSPFSKDFTGIFHGPIEVFAKHGLQILVYKLSINPGEPYWENNDPIAKQLMLVGLTQLPKEIVGDFSAQIKLATKIAFIQLTGDRFIANFKAGNIEFSSKLKRFWVFMPSPAAYSSLHMPNEHPPLELVRDCVEAWRGFFSDLATKFPNADLKLGLFNAPPFLGASFLDWDRPNGRIHVSPYVWDVAAPKCPGFDLQWLGKAPSVMYETYVAGLEYLNYVSENHLKNQSD